MEKGKPKKSKRKPVNSMRDLESKGFISELVEYKKLTGQSIWKFRMGKFTFHHSDKSTDVDLSKYCIKIAYNSSKRPPENLQVWIENFKLPKGAKHLYPDGTLCLFKPKNFKWKKRMTIEKNLFSSICTWLYHHEIWERTGIWHGEEAKH